MDIMLRPFTRPFARLVLNLSIRDEAVRMRDTTSLMFIFLDFDGVLRRKQSPLYKLEEDCLRTFENAVRLLPNAQIVITSSWRIPGMPRSFAADFASSRNSVVVK